MPFCAFSSLSKGEYSNLFILAAFYRKSFSCKTSLPVKNLYLLTLANDKAEIKSVCLSKLYRALFCSIVLLIVLIFSLILTLK